MARLVRTWILVVALSAAPVSASAAGWRWPVGSSLCLRFGESWVDAEGAACVHRGIDIAAGEGTAVRACAGGTVAFCGPVPSSAGGRVLAVTVNTADGLRVTYMPLETSELAAGAAVAPGDTIGTLAAAGDGSSLSAHLHLSVRRGETAIDPEPLLEAPEGPLAAPPAVSPMPPPASPAPVATSVSLPPAAAVAVPSPVKAAREAPGATAPRPAGSYPAEPRATRTPRRGEEARPPGPSVLVPRVPLPTASAAVRLGLGVTAALALWALAGRRAVPLRVRVRR